MAQEVDSLKAAVAAQQRRSTDKQHLSADERVRSAEEAARDMQRQCEAAAATMGRLIDHNSGWPCMLLLRSCDVLAAALGENRMHRDCCS
jgi:hypothetical protein